LNVISTAKESFKLIVGKNAMSDNIKIDRITSDSPVCKRPTDVVHHHKGKTSEGRLDKNVILKELNILPGRTILDAGCGNGYMSKEFARLLKGLGYIYALDSDEEAIEILKKETKGTVIKPLVADITKMTPIGASFVDLIYMSNVFHGFSANQIPDFQKEVQRLLKPGALLAIIEINKDQTPFGPPMNIRYSPEELKQAITLTAKATIKVGQYYYMQLFENAKNV
jgi:ubiquinone/menaquinone biosynthesis C-methylase UbiE